MAARENSQPCATLCRSGGGWHKVPWHKVPRHKVAGTRLPPQCYFPMVFFICVYIVFLLFVTVFFVFQCFLRCCCIDGAGMEPPDAQLCRDGWVMCHEGGAVVAETYWGALRVPHAPSVQLGAAYCCH